MGAVRAETFADLLRLHRQASGLTQEQLAERANLSLRAVSDLERGIKQHPRRYTVQMLAAALELTPAQCLQFERAGAKSLPPMPAAEALATISNSSQTTAQINLPLQITSFIGRERELRQLEKLFWRAGVRLVTLIGPGGSGKTRLALETAASLRNDFADGVYFVNLAPLGKPELVAAAIAGALQLKEAGDSPPLENLKTHLRQRSVLLILDNFEHLLAAGPLVAELLAVAGRLKVLATSREPLRIRGEQQFPVLPLSLPDADILTEFDQLGGNEAVRLFLDRATAVRPDFALTAENSRAIVAITRRLDGLPLAIELAAVRVKALTPQMLLQRLESRLKLLQAGAPDLPLRQQTLHSTIEWSYNLLPDAERVLFCRLAAFSGGLTPTAVSAVCNADGALDLDVLDGLISLLDKSLLYSRDAVAGEPHFWMLETIHEFARKQLEESGAAAELASAHAAFFLQLAEQAEPELRGKQAHEWLERLEQAHDDLRTALEWSLGSARQTALGARLAAALWRFWQNRGYLQEGRDWLELAVRRGEQAAGQVRAKLFNATGNIVRLHGDFAAARSYFEQSLALRRELGDRAGAATALLNLGNVAYFLGDYLAARTLLEESLVLSRELDDQWTTGLALNSLGNVTLAFGDAAQARTLYEESMLLLRAAGDAREVGIVLQNLGQMACDRKDYAAARLVYADALALRQSLGDKLGVAYVLKGLADVARGEADFALAHSLYRQSLSLLRELGDKLEIAACLEAFASLLNYGSREPVNAAILFAAAATLRHKIGAGLTVNDGDYASELAELRRTLDGEVWSTAWASGGAMSADEAISYALA